MIFLYAVLFLLLLSLVGIGLLIYSRRKKSVIGLVISAVILLFVLLSVFANNIDEWTISKKEVVADLAHIDLTLKDDFEIISNSVVGMPERFQTTEIRVSHKDKDRLIKALQKNDNLYPAVYSREIYAKIDGIQTRIILTVYPESDTVEYQRLED